MPRPVRVWELAEDLAVTSAEVLDALRAQGEWATSHLNVIPEVHLLDLRQSLTRDRNRPATTARGAPVAPVPVPPAPRGARPPDRDAPAPHRPRSRPNPFGQPARQPRRKPGPAPITYQRPPEPYYEDDDYAYYDDPVDDLRHEPVVSTRDVAELCAVSPATVRQWVSRGHLKPIGTDGPSHIFNTRDVLAAERDVAARRHRRATPATPTPIRRPDTGLNPDAFGGPRRPPGRLPATELHRLARVYTKLVIDTAAAAGLLGLAPATIRSWVRRGHLTPIPGSSTARHEYRLADVLHAAGIHTP